MCGIAGIVAGDGATLQPKALASMSELIRHRGPDGSAFLWWSGTDTQPLLTTESDEASLRPDWHLGLAHRRLAILDVGQNGSQPMLSRCGRFAIVFNGEIYNYVELRAELEKLGCRFRSTGDTEVLLVALSKWGESVLPRLVGMFAFVFVDFLRRRLLLARDHFGMKPLYYACESGRFMFASEIKALVPQLGDAPRAAPSEVFRFLRYGITDDGPDTMISQIKRIPPAHWACLSLDSPTAPFECMRYWAPLATTEQQTSKQSQTRFRKAFIRSVAVHLRSDVPIAVTLSGGLDSSSLVAAMRQLLGSAAEINSFTYVPEGDAPNEKEWAAIVSGRSATIAHYCQQPASAAIHLLSEMAYVLDEPYTSASILAQHAVFQSMHAHGIKVSLDGQGADEYLAGYPIFVAGRFAELLRMRRFASAIRLVASTSKGYPGAAVRIVAQSLFLLLPPLIRLMLYRVGLYQAFPGWLRKGYFADGSTALLRPTRLHWPDAFKGQLREALTRTSLPMLLRYADRNSMHFSLESRLPFLDHRLVDYALSLPSDMLMDEHGITKCILRDGLKDLTAREILERRDKVGFETAQAAMLRNELAFVEEIMLSSAASLPCLNVDRLLLGFRRRKIGHDVLWRCISLALWARRFKVSFN
jgi:asparagine synthase (glutamine-hydrolysing)